MHFIDQYFNIKQTLVLQNRNYLTKDEFLPNFDIYYKNEIVISYNILAAFLKRNFKINLKYDEWLHFCITLSDLYELYKYKE
jgi:hypothetical protein